MVDGSTNTGHGKSGPAARGREPGARRGNSSSRWGRDDFPRTPIGPFHTEEQKLWLKQAYCFGAYPRMYSKDHAPSKASFPVPVMRKKEATKQQLPSLAEKIIERIPAIGDSLAKRRYWEHSVFDAYLHLFGLAWDGWGKVLPWLKGDELAERAASCQSVGPWDWIAKREFVVEHGLDWSLNELSTLISWYTTYQVDEDEQRIFVEDRSFEEIVRVARLLGLPSQSDLDRLARAALDL